MIGSPSVWDLISSLSEYSMSNLMQSHPKISEDSLSLSRTPVGTSRSGQHLPIQWHRYLHRPALVSWREICFSVVASIVRYGKCFLLLSTFSQANILGSLHDLRSPAAFIATFNDPINSNTAAIYSLLPLGRDRFLAGSSQFASINLFNMYTVVNKLCHQTHSLENSLVDKSQNQSSVSINHTDSCQPKLSTRQEPRSRDWTCFLADRRNTERPRNPREWSSPVYSLSSPSLCSPIFFAGIEGHVIQVDVSSAYDRFPDPIYNYEPQTVEVSKEDAIQKWDPYRNVMSVNLYEHDSTNIELMHQARIGERQPGDRMPGWDERWYSGKPTHRG